MKNTALNSARWLTPLALIVSLMLSVYPDMAAELDNVVAQWFAFGAVLATAVGIELTGMMVGETMEGYIKRKQWGWAAFCAILLTAYVVIFFNLLEGELRFVPFLSVIVYVVAPLFEDVQRASEAEAQQTAVELEQVAEDRQAQREADREQREHERQMEREQREHERQLAARQLEIDAEKETAVFEARARIAEAEAKKRTIVQTEARTAKAEKVDWRTMSETEKRGVLGLSREDVMERYQIDRKQAGRMLSYAQRDYGHLSIQMSVNGMAK